MLCKHISSASQISNNTKYSSPLIKNILFEMQEADIQTNEQQAIFPV